MAERIVQFWHVTDHMHNPLPGIFPAGAVIRAISDLPAADRYIDTSDDMRLLAIPLRDAPPQHAALCRVRRDNLPSLERAGQLGDLRLARDQNLAEATHFRFFNRNVVGMLYNHDGPRIGRLAKYLEEAVSISISFAPVLDADTARRLDRMGPLTSVNIGLSVARAHLLDDDSDDPTGPSGSQGDGEYVPCEDLVRPGGHPWRRVAEW
jgi:hypothetical protein